MLSMLPTTTARSANLGQIMRVNDKEIEEPDGWLYNIALFDLMVDFDKQ